MPTWPEGHVEGLARLDLVATQDLGELSLDLRRATTDVRAVRVDGTTAAHRADPLGRKLIVPLGAPRSAGDELAIEVEWAARPEGVHRLGEGIPLEGPGRDRLRDARGFLPDGDAGFFLASQPNGAHTLFPSNDHPTDKATFTVRLTSPAGDAGGRDRRAYRPGRARRRLDDHDLGVGRARGDPCPGDGRGSDRGHRVGHPGWTAPAIGRCPPCWRPSAATASRTWTMRSRGWRASWACRSRSGARRAAGAARGDGCGARGPDAHPRGGRVARPADARVQPGRGCWRTRWHTSGSATRCRW